MSENVQFSAKQRMFIEWLARTKFEREPATQGALAKEIGVNEKTISRWKKLPEIWEAVQKRANELLHEDLPEIKGALRREAMKGNFQHIKLALEITGEYVEKRQHELSGEVSTIVKVVKGVSLDDV